MRPLLGRWTVTLTAAVALAAPAGAHAAPSPKLDSGLAQVVRADDAGQPVQDVAAAHAVTVSPGGRVLAEVYATTGPATAERRIDGAGDGVDVIAAAPGPGALSVATAWVPVEQLDAVAEADGVRTVLPVQGVIADTGTVLSQGDAAHRGPQARALGATGAGVKVGVISDSINQVSQSVGGTPFTGIAASQAGGELPASVAVISDQTGGSDEGRAMSEIIYDTAPGITQMAFGSGTAGGSAGKVNAIDGLVAAGAKIIADDIAFLSEPFFQDGAIAQAADRARAAGVLYFASAGNRGRQSYESAPRFSGAGTFHDFDPGAGTDTTQTLVTVPDGKTLTVFLQWDESWGAAKTNIDTTLVNAASAATLMSAVTNNATTGIPRENVSWTNTTGADVSVGLRIRYVGTASGGPAVTTLKYIANGDFGTFGIGEYATSSDAINPDAASSRGALAVAAVNWDDIGLNSATGFSSRGPKTRLFDATGARLGTPDVRQKPDVAAANRVATSVPGFLTFSGTSAAAPAAAGVAALVLSARPSIPYSLLRAIMTDPRTTSDCTGAGLPDLDCGWGFVFADTAVAMAQDTTPPVVGPTGAPAPGAWATSDVNVAWSATDAQSPTEVLSGCAPFTVTSDGETTRSCQVRSVGGTTTTNATIRRDTVPPAAPSIQGIGATTYAAGALPAPSAISCASSDATSGLSSCGVTGYDASPGTHTLTATATDNAGLRSTSTLTYTVAPAATDAITSVGRKVSPSALIAMPSTRACVKRTRRLKLRIAPPTSGRVTLVRVRITGVKKLVTRTKAGAITLPKLGRRKVTVRVTVTLADGRTGSVSRTYRRC